MSQKKLKQTEKQFMAAVVQYAKLKRWKVYHTYSSIRSEKGFPDLTLCRVDHKYKWSGRANHSKPGRIVFAELKSEKGRLTPEQEHWLEDLACCPCEVYLWRPSDWKKIEETLE